MGRVKKSVVKRVLVPVLAVLVIAGVFAVSASAELPSAVDSAGSSAEVSQLPNGFSPEGIAIDERAAVAYTGSLVDGAIERIDLKTGEATPFAPSPGPHRMASGMDIDRFGRLWVAGGGGFVPGVVSGFRVYDTRSGAVPADVTVPDAGYLNDVTVTRGAAWFTDSLGPALIRVPIGADGTIGSPEKVVLGGDWVQTSGGFNANGIETTPDGRHLIVNQTQSADAHSAFYLVPTQVAGLADARRVTLDGTTDEADGLELIGRTLYVANPQGVVEINLSGSLTDGQILGTTGVPGAAWPSAAKAFGGRLYVLDANFGDNLSNVGNPAAAFQVIAIPLP